MPFALKTSTRSLENSARASTRAVSRYTLLNELQGSIRTNVWLGLCEGVDALSEVVVVKLFYPHQPGAARDSLTDELELANALSHENVARTLNTGCQAGRQFMVNEYLEGATLQTVLRCAGKAGARLGDAAVVRVLLALVAAVDHAERVSPSIATWMLSQQPIAVDDVFISYAGEVKLLGFKNHSRADFPSNLAMSGATFESAVDALLSSHLTPALGAVLLRASSPGVRPCDRLWHVARALKNWQTEELGSDGRSELVTLMSALPAAARLERRARLEAAFENARQTPLSISWPPLEELEESAPLSGSRRIEAAGAPTHTRLRLIP